MADPQGTFGDLLGKLGISMGDSESRRQDMIRRLKTVKDPEERDQIIWALSGLKRGDTGYRSSPGLSGWRQKAEKMSSPASASPRVPAGPAPGAPPETQTGRQTRVGSLVGYVVPVLFVLFGISNIARAIEAFRAGAGKEEVFVQLLIGVGFLLFAVTGLFSGKLKKTMEKARNR